VTDASLAPTRYIVLLQSLHSAPARAAELVESLPSEAHAWRSKAEDWNATQLVAHLLAAEPLFRARLARIVAEENPWLPYFGPDVARPEAQGPLSELLPRFRAERDRLLQFLSGLAPEQWERPAVHETLGPTTLARQVQNVVNHDTEHLGQLAELRRTWEHQAHV
jgi:uncharacterized damage-inducible protein DinB